MGDLWEMEAFQGTLSTSVCEATGMGCLEGIPPISDIAIFPGRGQARWRDALAMWM